MTHPVRPDRSVCVRPHAGLPDRYEAQRHMGLPHEPQAMDDHPTTQIRRPT